MNVTSGETLNTPGEAYRNGFRDGVTSAVCAIGVLIIIFALAACTDADQMQRYDQAQKDAELAAACRPMSDERRIVEWQINEGEPTLTVTVQRFAGRKDKTVQYVLISETEIR